MTNTVLALASSSVSSRYDFSFEILQ